MIAVMNTPTPVPAGVDGRSKDAPDSTERPQGRSFGEILGAEGASRAPASGAVADSRGGKATQAGGKELPEAAVPPSAAGQALPADNPEDVALTADQPLAAGDAPAAATGPGTGASTLLSPESIADPVQPGSNATNFTADTDAAIAHKGVLPIGDAGVTGARGPASPALPASPASPAVPASPAAAVRAAPASPATTGAAQEPLLAIAEDTPLPLPVSVAGGVRHALAAGDSPLARLTPETAAASSAMRAAPATAVIGTADQVVMPTAGEMAQGDASKLPTAWAEAMAGESVLNRSGSANAPVPAAAFATQLQVAAGDPVQGAKPGVLPTLHAPPGGAAFDAELAGRVSLLVRDGLSEARLQLNPPELGRLDIRISTDGDQTRVMFTVQGADARDAIEQAMPRLREMLEQSGLQLSRFDVADHSRSQQGHSGSAALYGADAGSGEAELAEQESALPAAISTSQSLVDYYV